MVHGQIVNKIVTFTATIANIHALFKLLRYIRLLIVYLLHFRSMGSSVYSSDELVFYSLVWLNSERYY